MCSDVKKDTHKKQNKHFLCTQEDYSLSVIRFITIHILSVWLTLNTYRLYKRRKKKKLSRYIYQNEIMTKFKCFTPVKHCRSLLAKNLTSFVKFPQCLCKARVNIKLKMKYIKYLSAFVHIFKRYLF